MFSCSLFTHNTVSHARAARSSCVVPSFIFVGPKLVHKGLPGSLSTVLDQVVQWPPRVAGAPVAVRGPAHASRYSSRLAMLSRVLAACKMPCLPTRTTRAAHGCRRKGSWFSRRAHGGLAGEVVEAGTPPRSLRASAAQQRPHVVRADGVVAQRGQSRHALVRWCRRGDVHLPSRSVCSSRIAAVRSDRRSSWIDTAQRARRRIVVVG